MELMVEMYECLDFDAVANEMNGDRLLSLPTAAMAQQLGHARSPTEGDVAGLFTPNYNHPSVAV